VNLATLPLASAVPVTQAYPFMANCIECALAADQDSFQVRGLLLLTFEPTLVVTDARFVRFEYAGSNLLAPFSVTLPGGGGDLLFDSEMGNAIAAAEWSAVKTRIEFHLDRMR
jgi:hypothetical protein